MSGATDRDLALAYLRSHHVMSVATHGAHGPWNTALFYASQGFDLYFVSAASSTHCRHIEQDGRVAVTIQDNDSDWRAIKGLQIAAHAEPVRESQQQRVVDLYVLKFPFLRAEADAPSVLAGALARSTWYRICARRVCFVNNENGFGRRAEIDLSGGSQAG